MAIIRSCTNVISFGRCETNVNCERSRSVVCFFLRDEREVTVNKVDALKER